MAMVMMNGQFRQDIISETAMTIRQQFCQLDRERQEEGA